MTSNRGLRFFAFIALGLAATPSPSQAQGWWGYPNGHERAWRQQVKQEEAGLPAAAYARLRWLLLSVCLAAIVFFLFQRLGQLG